MALMELWQMAARWLAQVGVLPSDSPPLAKNGRVYDLALALQDGAVLCNAINRIAPNTIAQVHQKSEKQFLILQNINAFIEACVSTFGIKRVDVFAADELYYASNFPKVVHTLSVLSKTQMAGIKGFQYFPKEYESAENKAEEDGDDLYGNLEEIVGECLSMKEAAQSMPIVLQNGLDDDQHDADSIYGQLENYAKEGLSDANIDEVYSDLVSKQRDDSQEIYSPGTTPQDAKRNHVLAELKDTETNYVALLNNIVRVFIRKMSSDPKAISKIEVATVFSNIEVLLSAHTAFAEELNRHLASHTGRIIGPCFLDAIKSFRCYGQFCCELPEAIKTIRILNERPTARRLMEEARVESKQRFPLQDLMNVPMQRILKYPLLLKELLKYTSDSHVDKENLKSAFHAVESLAKYINDSKKDYDTLKNIIASLKGYSGRPIKDYVTDGDLLYRCDALKQRQKLRYVFLFNSMVLCCKSKGQFYHFKAAIDLDQMEYTLEDVPSPDSVSKGDQDDKHCFYWMLRGRKGSTEIIHYFAAKNPTKKKKWMSELEMQLQTAKDKRTAPPATMPRGTSIPPPSSSSQMPTRESSRSSRNSADMRSLMPLPLPPTPSSTSPTPRGGSGAGPKQSYEEWVIGPPPPSSPPPPPQPIASPSMTPSTNDRYFGGRMPRSKADQLLESLPNGTYLVRESDSRPGDFSLSVVYGAVKHIKINRRGIKYEVAPDARAFLTVQELITHFQQHSLTRHFPGVDTTLITPFRDAISNKEKATSSSSNSSKLVGIGRARARFAYSSKNPDELSFDRGTELIILSMQDLDPGWWSGALPDGRVGVFPANHVQQL